jgi:hypothetical protein
VQAVIDMKADSCPGCSAPLSESLHVDGRPDPVYKAGYAVCLSCKAREKRMEEVEADDRKTHTKVHPGSRHWVILRSPE